MTVELFVFYVLAAVTVASGVMVVSARNPVHSVLFLILAFFNSAGLFILIGAEFLAMILVVVYVGAVAVLFMFVVMMLDINFLRMQEGFMRYLPVGLAIGIVLLAELVLVGGTWAARDTDVAQALPAAAPAVSNTQAIGQLLYTAVFLPVPGGRHDPAGRDHRCHHADAAAPARCGGRTSAGRSTGCAPRRSSCARCARGAASDDACRSRTT